MNLLVQQSAALILGCAITAGCAHGVDPERPSGAAGNAGAAGAGNGGSAGAGPGGAGAGGATTSSTTDTNTTTTTDTTTTSSTTSSTTTSSTTSTTTTTSSTTTTTTTTNTGTGGPFPDCLMNPPANCPVCQTQNASDKPICQQYLSCYIMNNCKPTDACGQNDGVCGVNKIGGGNAPQSAALATYTCACM